MATQAQLQQVQQLYVALLGRAADSAGQAFWANAIAAGTTTAASFAVGLTSSAEFQKAYAGLANDAFIDKVYNNVLGRSSDAAGKAFWLNALTTGTVTQSTFVQSLVSSLGTQDQQTINNKVFVAQAYSDAAGGTYNAAAGATVIANVTSNQTTVTAALATIANGSVAGVAPGVSLINALATAQANQAAFEKGLFATNPALDADNSGTITALEISNAFATANGARNTLTLDSTVVVNAKLVAANNLLATDKAAANANTASAALVSAFDTATANKAAATLSSTDIGNKGAAQAQTDALLGATGATVTYASLNGSVTSASAPITSIATLYTALTTDPTLTAADRTTLVNALNKLGAPGTALVAAANKDVAFAKADAALTTATTNANADALAKAYVTDVGAQKAASDLATKVAAADTALAAIKVISDQDAALVAAVTKATTDITNFGTANPNAKLVDLSGAIKAGLTADAAPTKDVFYFGKAAAAATDDGAITGFAAGDSIVVGSGYTFNAGGLAAGNNAATEFFLVQGATGVQVILENNAFGSTTGVVAANGTVTTPGTDALSIITLTGVTLDHLAVSNGVISYV